MASHVQSSHVSQSSVTFCSMCMYTVIKNVLCDIILKSTHKGEKQTLKIPLFGKVTQHYIGNGI